MSTLALNNTVRCRVVPRSLLFCKNSESDHATIAAKCDKDWRGNKENVPLLKQARCQTNSDKFKKIYEALGGLGNPRWRPWLLQTNGVLGVLGIGTHEGNRHNGVHCTPHCNGNSVYIFLFWELRGLSPNFHIHEPVSDLCIPWIGPHISSSREGRPILGIYNSLTDT